MPLKIVRNNIVNMDVEVIVNTANPNPVVGFGVDSIIHQKAGKALLAYREKLGRIESGDAKITPGFQLKALYVIHTVGPIWEGGTNCEEAILASCYRKSLMLAKEKGCHSIAFPLIATGNYGFPKELALRIAVREIRSFLDENEMFVYLVVFDKASFVVSKKLCASVQSYIEEQEVYEKKGKVDEDEYIALSKKYNCFIKKTTLEEFIGTMDAGFSETLLYLIDKKNKKDSEVYKKANVDRRLFSKIKKDKAYQPSKTTALAFAFALELTLEETKDFIGRAGFALSHSRKFDLIVEYFLVYRKYDIYELNEVLFAFDQPLIGF